MKKIIIFICIFFINNTHIFSMDPDVYCRNIEMCEKINSEQERKFLTFINTVTMENKSDLLQSIENKFTKLKSNIEKKEHDVIFKIKDDLKINDEIWKGILTINQMVQQYEEKCQDLSILNVIHDTNIPPAALYIFKKHLIKNNINPNRINIQQTNRWIVESPIPSWSICDNILIYDSFTLPGIIELPFNEIVSVNDLKAFSIIYSYVIKSKKRILTDTFFKYTQNFNTTVEELIKNKSFIEYTFNIIRFAHIKAAYNSQKYAHLLHAFNNRNVIADDAIFTNAQMHTVLSKIKRYWNSIAWLKKYNNKVIQLPIKKDPTLESVTFEELHIWKKDNNFPVCLPIRFDDFNSLNIFDILKTKSFIKPFTGEQDKLAYSFFKAIINDNPIYEHIKTNDNNFKLKILSPTEYNLNILVTKYREGTIRKAVNMANQYARRKGLGLINIE